MARGTGRRSKKGREAERGRRTKGTPKGGRLVITSVSSKWFFNVVHNMLGQSDRFNITNLALKKKNIKTRYNSKRVSVYVNMIGVCGWIYRRALRLVRRLCSAAKDLFGHHFVELLMFKENGTPSEMASKDCMGI